MNYKEIINNMKKALDTYKVPCTINQCWEGYQLLFNWTVGDVAIHDGTYGHEHGDVETYEFPWDEGDVTQLTPDEAVTKIRDFYYQVQNKEGDCK